MTALLAAWSWFTGTKAGQIVLALGAAMLVLWRVLVGVKQAERDKLQAQAQARDLANRDTRNEVDRAVARDPDPAERLRRDWSRD